VPDIARTVVFDIGGVLIDWDPRYLYRRLLPDEAAVDRFLTEVCTAAWNREQDRGRPWPEAVAELTARFPDEADLIAAYHERWLEMVPGAIDESVALLYQLRHRRVPLYALTNFSVDKFHQTRQRFGFLDWFDAVVVSGEEGLVKPDPALYRVLLDRYRLDPDRVVYIDDTLVNVTTAADLGMTALHFTGPAQLQLDLSGLGLLDGVTSITTLAQKSA
jgi:2-haloacid dehalogenase